MWGCFATVTSFSVSAIAMTSQRKTRRSDGPIATPLECFRQGKDSESMRNALAELAMRLVDAQDREEFRKADGVTAIGRFLVGGSLRWL